MPQICWKNVSWNLAFFIRFVINLWPQGILPKWFLKRAWKAFELNFSLLWKLVYASSEGSDEFVYLRICAFAQCNKSQALAHIFWVALIKSCITFKEVFNRFEWAVQVLQRQMTGIIASNTESFHYYWNVCCIALLHYEFDCWTQYCIESFYTSIIIWTIKHVWISL